MLHTREAWAFAAMGRPAAFNRATDRARLALTDAPVVEEPYWIAYFDEAELAGVTGGRLLDLARNDAQYAESAVQEIQQALANRGAEAARSHALDRIGLAECHFLVGDVREAADETHRAVAAADRTGSDRVRLQLGALYPYTVGHSASQPVREARECIRTALAN